jgi:hypothetical protein
MPPTALRARSRGVMATDDAVRAELAGIEREIRRLVAKGDLLRGRLPEYRFSRAPGYRGTHWGSGGDHARGRGVAGDPRGRLHLLGTWREVAYEATKTGYPAGSVFRHAFKSPPPAITYTDEGKLVIVGGKYRVTMRGIEG